MNVPNILSLFRLLLVPVFPITFFSRTKYSVLLASIVYFVAFLTDILDGRIARKYNLITKLGRILDPLADKLMSFTVVVCIEIANIIPLWAVIIFFIKEACLGLGAIVMYKKMADVISAKWIGKLATASFFVVCVILMLFQVSEGTATALISVALAISIAAFIQYFVQFLKLMPKKNLKS